LGYIEKLAGEIVVREARSDGERAAARYVTAVEPFMAATLIDSSAAVTAGGASVRPFMMRVSATGEATGRLVYGRLGAAEELATLDLEGACCWWSAGCCRSARRHGTRRRREWWRC
jgi:hypothetical protein